MPRNYKRWWYVVPLVALAGLCGVWFWGRGVHDRWLEKQAQQALAQNDFGRAMQLANQLLHRQTNSAAALRVAAESSRKMGQVGPAIEHLRRLDALGALTAAESFQLGDLWLVVGRAADAERYLSHALDLDPELNAARMRLIQLLTVQCRTHEAREQRYYLLRRQVWSNEDLLYLAKPEDLTNSDDLEFFLKQDPENPYLYLARARQAKLTSKYAEAEDWLNRALQLNPDLVEAHADRGLLLLERPFSREKFEAWQRALPEQSEQHPDVWYVRGMWAKSQGDLKGAARCFGEALSRDPLHRVAMHQLSLVLASLGEPSLASQLSEHITLLDELTRAVDDVYESPQSGQHWWRAAEALEALGRLHEAAAWYYSLAAIDRGRSGSERRAKDLASRIRRGSPIISDERNLVRQMNLTQYPLPALSARNEAPATSKFIEAERNIRFSEVAESLGIDFTLLGAELPVRRVRRIFELFGAGIGVLDFDLDGWPDLYLGQAGREIVANTPPANQDRQSQLDQIYWNHGGASFQRVTEQAGLSVEGFTQGVAVGDWNNDGFPDVLVAIVGENRLFQNNGDGTFMDVTATAGIAGSHWTSSCVIADLNGDGWPDIYEVNYLGGPDVYEALCGDEQAGGRPCRPRDFLSAPDRFFLSLGDGRFIEQSAQAGLVAPDGKGLGVVAADFEGTGQLSLFVANDTTANHFFVNQAPRGGSPLFEERAALAGLAFDRNGVSQACMGIAIDDADADGQLDLFVTNFLDESNTLYRGLGKNAFEDATRTTGLHVPSLAYLGFGTQFLDADLDGHPDLIVANGHIADEGGRGARFQMPPQFFQNRGGTFAELQADQLGDYFQRRLLGRALARLDFNRDGREDVVVSHLDAPVALLRNDSSTTGHFLTVRLVGRESERDAIGTTVTVTTANGLRRTRQLTAGDGYECSNQRQLVFGLGTAPGIANVTVRWPTGIVEQFERVELDRSWILIEGRAAAVEQTCCGDSKAAVPE